MSIAGSVVPRGRHPSGSQLAQATFVRAALLVRARRMRSLNNTSLFCPNSLTSPRILAKKCSPDGLAVHRHLVPSQVDGYRG